LLVRTRWGNLWDHLRSTYWFLPTGMTVGAVALAVLTTKLDHRLHRQSGGQAWTGWLWEGGAEGAREVLSIIASSAINLAGVTFSITIVALTLASSQFGPRMLRNFMRDTGNQVVLGTFVATFTYCLLALRTLRAADQQLVPHVSVTVGLALALLSLGVLIFFIHHVASSIQAERLVANVAADLHEAIEKMFPERSGAAQDREDGRRVEAELPKATPFPVRATGRGYVQAIDGAQLLQTAEEEDLVIRAERRPGDFVADGELLASVWPAERCGPELSGRIRDSFLLGRQRTQFQDIEYTLHQLVEIAVRALSPAYNDPFTAMACLDWLGSALAQLAGRDFPAAWQVDAQGRLRLVMQASPFHDLVDATFNQIRQNGRKSVSVTLRILTVIGRVATHAVRPADRRALRCHAGLVLRDAREELTNENDLHEIELRYQETMAVLALEDAPAGRGEFAEDRAALAGAGA
jgi:uncharacterized membrane protein